MTDRDEKETAEAAPAEAVDGTASDGTAVDSTAVDSTASDGGVVESTATRSDGAAVESTATRPDEQQAGADAQHTGGVARTRISGLWTAVAFAVVVLLLLLIFILQNPQPVAVSYFGATGRIPLGVALLLGAVGGALLVIVIGVARIMQLRHQAWRHRRKERSRDRRGRARS